MKNLLKLAAVFGLLSSSAAFAIDDGKLNLICTVHYSTNNLLMRKSPSSSKIIGAVENNAVVTLLDVRWGMAHIRKNLGTTGWIGRGFLDCPRPALKMPEPLQGKWCHSVAGEGLQFFQNQHEQHRLYVSCNESGEPELGVSSDEVKIEWESCQPIQATKFDVCTSGHGHIYRDDSLLGYDVKLLCQRGLTPAHDWIVGYHHGDRQLNLGLKRDRIRCPR